MSFASIVAIKGADIYRKQDYQIRLPFASQRPAEAFSGPEDLIGNIIK